MTRITKKSRGKRKCKCSGVQFRLPPDLFTKFPSTFLKEAEASCALDRGEGQTHCEEELGTVVVTAPAPKHVLLEAHDIIEGDRAKEYGPIREDYKKVTDLFRILTGVDLTPELGVVFMKCVKLSRLANFLRGHTKFNKDTLRDDLGYTAKLCRMFEGLE